MVGWPEFEPAFDYNKTRRDLIKGMRMALLNLKRAGCLMAYIDGSFVTQKCKPGDYDSILGYFQLDRGGGAKGIVMTCLGDLHD